MNDYIVIETMRWVEQRVQSVSSYVCSFLWCFWLVHSTWREAGGCANTKLLYIYFSFVQSTGASIQVASEMLPNSTERAVTVSGTADAITQCIKYICGIMQEVSLDILILTPRLELSALLWPLCLCVCVCVWSRVHELCEDGQVNFL